MLDAPSDPNRSIHVAWNRLVPWLRDQSAFRLGSALQRDVLRPVRDVQVPSAETRRARHQSEMSCSAARRLLRTKR